MIPGMRWHLRVHLNLFKMGPPLSYLNKQFVHLMSYKGHRSGKHVWDLKLRRWGTERGRSAAYITHNLQGAPAPSPPTAREGQRLASTHTGSTPSSSASWKSSSNAAVCISFLYISVSPGSHPAAGSPSGSCALENQTEKTAAIFIWLSHLDAPHSLVARALTCPCLYNSRSHEALHILQHSSTVPCVGWAGPSPRLPRYFISSSSLQDLLDINHPRTLGLGSPVTNRSHGPCPRRAQDQVGCTSMEFLWR